eukprot:5420083-Prymnesium_polylepis.1
MESGNCAIARNHMSQAAVVRAIGGCRRLHVTGRHVKGNVAGGWLGLLPLHGCELMSAIIYECNYFVEFYFTNGSGFSPCGTL